MPVPAPIDVPGRTMVCGPSEEPAHQVHAVDTHEPVVEEVGLQHAAAVDGDAVARGG